MNYLKKSAKVLNSLYNFSYQKPDICPYCGLGTDAPIKETSFFTFDRGLLLVATCQCTACGKIFFFACHKTEKDFAENVSIYPSLSFTPYENPILSKISERFISMYNQSLASEHAGNIELAAIGYRSALEILVKDYAISELGENKDRVSGKKLFDAIKDYLKQNELIATADVVRILGNDYTHYERKYPQHDFELLKKYMEIFLGQIELEYMIKHPPISRS